MSPEQAAGQTSDLGPATDVYSLGATLYCLLTGKTPFETFDPALIYEKISSGEFPRPRQVDSRVPVALEAICLKAMALDPGGRYSTPRRLATTSSAGWPISRSWHIRSRSRPGPCAGFAAASNG